MASRELCHYHRHRHTITVSAWVSGTALLLFCSSPVSMPLPLSLCQWSHSLSRLWRLYRCGDVWAVVGIAESFSSCGSRDARLIAIPSVLLFSLVWLLRVLRLVLWLQTVVCLVFGRYLPFCQKNILHTLVLSCVTLWRQWSLRLCTTLWARLTSTDEHRRTVEQLNTASVAQSNSWTVDARDQS